MLETNKNINFYNKQSNVVACPQFFGFYYAIEHILIRFNASSQVEEMDFFSVVVVFQSKLIITGIRLIYCRINAVFLLQSHPNRMQTDTLLASAFIKTYRKVGKQIDSMEKVEQLGLVMRIYRSNQYVGSLRRCPPITMKMLINSVKTSVDSSFNELHFQQF